MFYRMQIVFTASCIQLDHQRLPNIFGKVVRKIESTLYKRLD